MSPRADRLEAFVAGTGTLPSIEVYSLGRSLTELHTRAMLPIAARVAEIEICVMISPNQAGARAYDIAVAFDKASRVPLLWSCVPPRTDVGALSVMASRLAVVAPQAALLGSPEASLYWIRDRAPWVKDRRCFPCSAAEARADVAIRCVVHAYCETVNTWATSAMMAGLTDHRWSVDELLATVSPAPAVVAVPAVVVAPQPPAARVAKVKAPRARPVPVAAVAAAPEPAVAIVAPSVVEAVVAPVCVELQPADPPEPTVRPMTEADALALLDIVEAAPASPWDADAPGEALLAIVELEADEPPVNERPAASTALAVVPRHEPLQKRKHVKLTVLKAEPDLEPTMTTRERVEHDAMRPRTRGECIGGERPCPWVSCHHHINGEEPERILRVDADSDVPTCTLDVADEGGATLDAIAIALDVTRERIRQIEAKGLAKLRRPARAEILIEAAPHDPRDGVRGRGRSNPTGAQTLLSPAMALIPGKHERMEANALLYEAAENDGRLDALLPQQQRVLALYHADHVDMKGIAAMLGWTESRVAHMANRARIHLRSMANDNGEEVDAAE